MMDGYSSVVDDENTKNVNNKNGKPLESHDMLDVIHESVARVMLDSLQQQQQQQQQEQQQQVPATMMMMSAENRGHLQRVLDITGKLRTYCEHHSTQPSPALQGIRRRTNEFDWERFCSDKNLAFAVSAGQMIGATEGNLIGLLARITKAKHCLEIGTFTGYGSVAMAEAVPADGTVTCLELQPDVAAQATENLALFCPPHHANKVSIKIGTALESLLQLVDEGKQQFDLVFIDADKASYEKYVNIVLDHLLSPDGLILVDNTLFGCGMFFDLGTEKGRRIAKDTEDFNRFLKEDPRIDQNEQATQSFMKGQFNSTLRIVQRHLHTINYPSLGPCLPRELQSASRLVPLQLSANES